MKYSPFKKKKGSSLHVKDQKICNSFFRHKLRLRCGHCDSGKLKAQDNTLKMAFGEKQDHRAKMGSPGRRTKTKGKRTITQSLLELLSLLAS